MPVMKTVRDLIADKGAKVWSVAPDTTVLDALRLMADEEIGAVLVLRGEQLVGIFTERHYAREVVLKGKASKDTPVRDVMTQRIVYVRPEQTMEDCMALMTDKRVRHLPVMEAEKLIGVLSIGDVVKAMISEKEFIIAQLENYISTG
jgi:CBS domain-containing protein